MLEGLQAYLRFEDGIEGVVDLGRFIRFEGVFAPCVIRMSSPG